MEDKKAPSIDMSKLQASITRIEFTNKMNDFRMQMRELSDTIFSVKKVNESLYIRVEELEREVEKLKKFSKKNKEE
jgi:hypothetical protein